jgi:hypothetical protein
MSNSKQPSVLISLSASVELRDWLKAKAAKDYRSMSAQAALLLYAAMAAERAKEEATHGVDA